MTLPQTYYEKNRLVSDYELDQLCNLVEVGQRHVWDDKICEIRVRSHPYQSEIDTQCKRVSEKLIFDRCDNCCDKCIFCDNAGGCLVESYRSRFHSYQSERNTCPQNKIWQHCPAAEQIRKQERDRVLVDSIERLSAIEHEQWIEWSKNITSTEPNLSFDRVERWSKLWIPYEQLSEDMKEHDRKWANKIIEELRQQAGEQ
jgi:hypothetical protein